jgi:hypothetical protein
LTVQDTAGKKDFEALVRQLVGLGQKVPITVIPLGLDDWEVRAGFTYWVAEKKQMKINLTDTVPARFRLELAGDSSLEETCELFRQKWNKPIWEEITIRRKDGAPFWVEDKGESLVEIMYNPNKDTRKTCSIKVVCSRENQIFLIENYRVTEEDPATIWSEVCAKYGFVSPGNTHLRVEGSPDLGLITYTYRLPASVMNVQLPIYHSRTFKIIVNEDVWETGEILSPASRERDAIWDQLSEIRALPHYSQFSFSYDHGEISATSRRLPPGHIDVVRIKFPVRWHLELFDEDFIQSNMHAGQTIQEAWTLLHNELPRLYQYASFNYAGFLQPNLTVTAEVIREDVRISFSFEVKDNGWITYRGHDAKNILTRQEIYTQYAQDDPRIPQLSEYIEEDTRH